jgi:hypothetical protein
MDWDAINSINYFLVWEAISEADSAPIKPYLDEIRVIQAEGQHRDSVQLWLEADPPEPKERATSETWRTRYIEWCERSKENPKSVAEFNSRLLGEGFRSVRLVSPDGKRPRGYEAPARYDVPPPGTCPVHERSVESLNNTMFISNCTNVPTKIDVGGKPSGEDAEGAGTPGTPVHDANDAPPACRPWPTPPSAESEDLQDEDGKKVPGRKLSLWVYDCEVFPNRFLFRAYGGPANDWRRFDETNLRGLATFVNDTRKVFAGFNNHAYDDILVATLARAGTTQTAKDIKALSDRIIEPKTEADREANFKVQYSRKPWAYSIDVFQLLNGKGSLKEWECRIGFPTVAETPADFDKDLPDDMLGKVGEYCENDVKATAEILTERWPLVELRKNLRDRFELGNRVYTLSEQGLAQHTVLTLHKDRTQETSGDVRKEADEAPENTADRFDLPRLISDRVEYGTDSMRDFLARVRQGAITKGDDGKWSIAFPGHPEDGTHNLAGCKVSLGVGGLHTVDEPGIFRADGNTSIVDLDVTSYYPSFIIGEGIYPSQLGPEFVTDFAKIRDQRIAAKRAGDKTTSEALKIVLNATFGKLNDRWSPIRSTSNAFKVTLNGQFFILMLMEALHAAGFEVLSANTDGVTLRGTKLACGDPLARIVAAWEAKTGLNLERTDYASLYRRDVNAYVAVSTSGKVKTKGPFNPESGKGDGSIIRDAAVAYLVHGTDPAETVAQCQDVASFLFYQRAKNGGDLYHGETRIGKTARWYAATDGQAIVRRNPNGTLATIPNGHRAALALDIRGWDRRTNMANLDTEHYIGAARELISALRAT